MNDKLNIAPLNPCSDDAERLLALSDAYMTALYPAESNHLESSQALAKPTVLFLGGTVAENLVACGAVKMMDDHGNYGEIKRVYVLDEFRGRGYSLRIMIELEAHLRTKGIEWARLETGVRQPEALGLYRKLGYVERSPFGKYKHDPLSVFMEKRLISRAKTAAEGAPRNSLLAGNADSVFFDHQSGSNTLSRRLQEAWCGR